MLDTYRKLRSLLTPRERKRALIVFGILVAIAIVETLGVASIMPFIAVLANPDIIQNNRYMAAAYDALGFDSHAHFTLFLGALFFFVFVSSLIFKAIGAWAQLRYAQNRDYAWASRLIAHYLRQPYEWFLNRHSADLATHVLTEVQQVVMGTLFPAMQVVAHSLVAILLLSLLVAADPVLATTVGGLIGGGYLFIAIMLKRRLAQIGAERQAANRARFHVAQEAFGGLKEVKVGRLEDIFAQRFRAQAEVVAARRISAGMISQMPGYFMQGLLFGGMLLVLIYLIWQHGGFGEALPYVALYSFAGYRLMPAIQSVYTNFSQIRFSEAALNTLCNDLRSQHVDKVVSRRGRDEDGRTRFSVRQSLALHVVSYKYPKSENYALESLSFEIRAFSTVGIVGATGSGKTTTVDVILGLLKPTSGFLSVDGVQINTTKVRAWQKSIGYVPQQIFLADDTIAANIAFGMPRKRVNLDSVVKAAKIANLHDFIENRLEHGYQTKVGERGVRLSGGQRQRIGIARALYTNPDVLILDEATSALDNLTEKAVMDAVHNLDHRKTVIIIAHRLSTVRKCDQIFLLDKGKLQDTGSYDDLLVKSTYFRRMVEAE